ncbi:RES family NAD+ phosphorylase [Paludisphaera rhizosphaerae]|uniref:RES family NAD+ phosphorylase n=1 Tax=Paludisphaera rhizosphaerae TaxID=2711216 RepID=UPI0013EA4559|nr:RES family NAD+ phosphorylase [Paludisphaera rhizosphaerae]
MLDRLSLDVELRALRRENVFSPIDSFGFRSIALRHFLHPEKPSPLHASPSRLIGSRFVSPGRTHRALYVALDAETAHREGNQPFYTVRASGVPPAKLTPPDEVVVIGVHIRVGLMLDLRSAEVQGRLGTSAEELAGKWKLIPDAPTQVFGDQLYQAGGFEGLIDESVRNPGGICLLVFPESVG